MAKKTGNAEASESVQIEFVTDRSDDGSAKVTKGRKHRFAEVPNTQFGTAIGTLYISEPAFERLGKPSKLTMTLDKAE